MIFNHFTDEGSQIQTYDFVKGDALKILPQVNWHGLF